MKFTKNILLFSATLFLTLNFGCKEANIDDEHHYDNRLYLTSPKITDDLLIKSSVTSASREVTYRLASPAEEDVQITFETRPDLTAAYNLVYHDEATAMPDKYYELSTEKTMIKKGDITGESVIVNFMNTNELDRSRRYVLPVRIKNASGVGVLESAGTVYYIFKGAALINVVANIRKMYFPINWKSDVSNISVITVEALVRAKDWIDGRDNPLSSVFGIEGRFLLRIGDADRPRDQFQLVAPGGNFPAPNVAPGLPTNEWVHIAVVYDSNTRERKYYMDGKLMAEDRSASGSFSLEGNCFVGKSWDDSRWLPGEISELRVWGVKRTADQIAGNPYEVDPESEGLIAYWKFNDGSGSLIKDHTGHGNDIQTSGQPEWVNVELPALK